MSYRMRVRFMPLRASLPYCWNSSARIYHGKCRWFTGLSIRYGFALVAVWAAIFAGCTSTSGIERSASREIVQEFRTSKKVCLTVYGVSNTPIKEKKLAIEDAMILKKLADQFRIHSSWRLGNREIKCQFHVAIVFEDGRGFTVLGDGDSVAYRPDLRVERHLDSGSYVAEIDSQFTETLRQHFKVDTLTAEPGLGGEQISGESE